MSYNFKLPDIGEGIHEGEIIKFYVKKGDFVEEEQLIAEVMTDKATVDLTSPVTGKVVDILTGEGQSVKVGDVFIIFEEHSAGPGELKETSPSLKEDPAETKAETDEELPAKKAVDIFSPPEDLGGMYSLKEETPEESKSDAPVRALPRTRKLAGQLNVDLHKVKPTGNNSRITDEDVRNFASGTKPVIATQETLPSTAFISPLPFDIAPISAEGIRKPLSGLRKKIVENMEQSHHFVPRAVHFEELDLTEAVRLRSKVKPGLEQKGIKITYLPFFIKAASIALKEFPQVNACFDEVSRDIVELKEINIGFAADTERGLMVPVLKNADKKSITHIAAETAKLADEARQGKISVENLKGGSFTLTNIGSIGGLISVPVVYHPQAAIMGMHTITPRPVVRNGEIVIREIMYVSLAFDHRIIDGAEAARFTARMKELLENPVLMMIEMK